MAISRIQCGLFYISHIYQDVTAAKLHQNNEIHSNKAQKFLLAPYQKKTHPGGWQWLGRLHQLRCVWRKKSIWKDGKITLHATLARRVTSPEPHGQHGGRRQERPQQTGSKTGSGVAVVLVAGACVHLDAIVVGVEAALLPLLDAASVDLHGANGTLCG